MTSAPPTFVSSSAIRPSTKLCRSRAAWYSAFSARSPCARASAIALVMAWRSTRLRRSSSSLSFSYPVRVIGVRWTAIGLTLPRALSTPARRGVEVDLDLRVHTRSVEPGFPRLALLLREHLLRDFVALTRQGTRVRRHALEHPEHVVALRRLHRLRDGAERRPERREHRVAG